VTSSLAIPKGFELIQQGSVSLIIAKPWREAVNGLGLLEVGRITRARRSQTGTTGRGGTEILPLHDGSARLLLRPVLHGGFLGPLLGGAHLSPARVLRELAATSALRNAGAPVPEPILALAQQRGFRFDLAIGTRFEEGTRDLLSWLANSPDAQHLERVAVAAGHAVRQFHDAGGMHADLHVKNLLLRNIEETSMPREPEVLVIDLDRARVGEVVPAARRAAELMRLYRSLIKRGVAEKIGQAPVQHFLDAYLQDDKALDAPLRTQLRKAYRRLCWRRMGYRLRGWSSAEASSLKL